MDPIIQEFTDTFRQTKHDHQAIHHPVWIGGQGPAIILMHEMDGFGKPFIQLALRLSQHFTVHAPVFYGDIGDDFSGPIGLARAFFCMRKEFEVFRLGKTSPVAAWIRHLASEIQSQHPDGKGVGVIGMCMTGGLVLATISHPGVAVAVAAQPALPLLLPLASRARRHDLGLDPSDVQAAAHSATPVLLLRYGRDPICPAERIETCQARIPSAILPGQQLQCKLDSQNSHPTLTDRFREVNPDLMAVSEETVGDVISFLLEHLG